MTGRELIKAAMKIEKVERVPWVPFVGCHGGLLIGATAEEILRSEDKIVAGATEAIRRYRPDGIPVTFDLQIEAEALGCDLVWAPENPPAVSSHPLAGGGTISSLKIPEKSDGRIGMIVNAARRLRAAHPDIALYGLVTGPFTLAMHLLGTDIFMMMFDKEEYVKELLDFCRDVCMRMSDYYIDAGCDIIAIVDPMTSQIGPQQFRQFVLPPASEIFSHIKESGTLSSFFVCGHAQQNIEVMCDCGPDNVSIDENIPLDFVRDVCLPRGISFGGNMQLTVVLLMGSEEDCQRNAITCMDIAGDRGFILAPGCDLPYATPPRNLEAVAAVVHDPYQRDVLRTLERTEKSEETLDMSEYGKTDKVIVDVITLDSESCAPCQYMVEAVKKVTPFFDGIVEWREHKIKKPESVMFMNSLMVKNIPTICIDGVITFVSKIPPMNELINAIQRRIQEKLRYKIRIRKGGLIVVGRDESEFERLRPLIDRAISETGADVPVEYITGDQQILSYGVTQTPAVISATYKIRSEGKLPEVAAIKEWIKEMA